MKVTVKNWEILQKKDNVYGLPEPRHTESLNRSRTEIWSVISDMLNFEKVLRCQYSLEFFMVQWNSEKI